MSERMTIVSSEPAIAPAVSLRPTSKIRLYQGSVLALFVVTSVMTVLFLTQRSKTQTAQARLDAVNILCRVARANLSRAAETIRTNGPTKAIEVLRVKEASLELDACPTTPFDFDRWRTCEDNSDDVCMATLLENVANNIERATRRGQLP